MSRELVVRPLPLQRRRGGLVIAARVSGHPRRRKRNGRIFFELPGDVARLVDDLPATRFHDALLRATVFSAMEAGRDLRFCGQVSRSLVVGLRRYAAWIRQWWPQYAAIEILPDSVIEDDSRPGTVPAGESLLAFSGGLDSVELLQRQTQPDAACRATGCLFVHGFDIPLGDRAFAGALRKAEKIARERGVPLLRLRTNLKERTAFWPNSHGAAVAAVLSLFASRWPRGLIAATGPRGSRELVRAGLCSVPGADELLSSADFRILHDSTDMSRVGKTAEVARWPTAVRNLRVCWQGRDKTTNCGRCFKCLWQMLCLRAVGQQELPAFAEPLFAERVAQMEIPARFYLSELQECLRAVQAAGRASLPEFQALAVAISRQQGHFERTDPAPQSDIGPRRRRWLRWLGRMA